jgi:hypothetical protein
MKKSLLVMSMSLLALAVLAGCNKPAASSTSSKAGTSSAATTSSATGTSSAATSEEAAPAITVTAGKTGFAVKIAFDGVTCPSYVSIWMTGCMAQVKGTDGKITATWKTGLDAIEMKAVTGHEGWYYGESDVYTTTAYKAALGTGVTDQSGEYSLVLGYNSTAEISDSKKGLQWVDAYKATYCASFAYPTNAKFAAEGGDGQLVTLHSDTFTAVPKKPEAPLTNYTVKIAFSESLPTYEVPHFLGSFDGWTTTYNTANELAHRMTTTDTDRKIWTYTFASIIPDSYDITMSLDYTIEAMSDQTSYSWTKAAEWTAGNLKMSVNSADGSNFVMADADAFVATISSADGTILSDPTIKYDYTFTLTNTGTAVAEDVYLSGAMTAWEQTAATKMTVDATGKIYTFTGVNHVAGSIKFRFLVGASWDHSVCSTENNSDSNNFVYKLPAKSGTVALSADMTNVLTNNVQVAPDSFTFTAAA